MDNNPANDDSVLRAIADNSMRGAGYAYLIGDAALFASGMMSGRKKEAAAGLIYATGGMAPAFFGKQDNEQKLSALYKKLGQHLKENGAILPADSPITTETLATRGGLIEQIQDFLYAHPSQTLNAIFAAGGTQLLRSGLQHKKHWDTASGALVAAGGLAGILIPEYKPDPQHPTTSTADKAWQWIQEKPLRLSGALYMLNNVTLAKSAYDEWKANPVQKSWMAKLCTVACYTVANGLLALSSKCHGDTTTDQQKEMMEMLERTAAHVIMAQPQRTKDALIRQVAGFLSAQPEIHMSAEELSQAIYDKVTQLAQPQPHTWQSQISATTPNSEQPQRG